MMGVCKSWNYQIRGRRGLFADIAFNTVDRATVSTATMFLEAVETESSSLRVYARCHSWPDIPTVSRAFLSRLRLQTWRFVCFEAEYMSARFTPFFNLPAPRLLRLVQIPTHPKGLFSASFSSLRVLDISIRSRFPWPKATLADLVVLRLEHSQFKRSFHAPSLFGLVERTHRLEELVLKDFLRFSEDYNMKPIIHINIKSIHFMQCNVKYILQHLHLPNAMSCRVESYGVSLDGELDPPLSRNVGHFAPLHALSVPGLVQNTVTGVAIHVHVHDDDVYIRLAFECEAGQTIDFTATFGKGGGWEAYLQVSIKELLQRTNLSTRIKLSIFRYSSSILGPNAPLFAIDLALCLPQVTILRTDDSLVQSILPRLTDPEHILPNLKCYSIRIEKQSAFADVMTPETTACLRSRLDRSSPFALQYWTPNGKAGLSPIFLIHADIRSPVGTGLVHTTTVLIRLSLPILFPFLKGMMGDRFTGEGGCLLLNGLYVERSEFNIQALVGGD